MNRALAISLLVIRWTLAAFLLVWAIDKVANPIHAQGVFQKFYSVSFGPQLILAIGVLQVCLLLAFAAGVAKTVTYGVVTITHAGSVASTVPALLNFWNPGGQLLFWAGVPVLGAMVALFLLRNEDTLFSLGGGVRRQHS